MRLIEWKNNKINISPEAYAIKAFRAMWTADKSRNKVNAVMKLGLLYFMYDPRSEYQFETDEEERFSIIKEQTGMAKNWKPDKLFQDAVPVYQYLTNTTSSLMLASNRKILNNTRKILEDFDLSEVDSEKQATVASGIFKSIEVSTDLMVKIAKAEKEIYKEVEEHFNKIRGKGGMTVGDKGLDELFKNEED